MMHLAGIFGYPLSHSISPVFQQAAFDYYGIPVQYKAWSTKPEEFDNQICKLRSEIYIGANVTVPYKQRVIPLLDSVDHWATTIGAVNTIVRTNDGIKGYNTDAYGFIKSLKEFGEFDPTGKRILILGAGGAARAAFFSLLEENIESIILANRTLATAEDLLSSANSSVGKLSAINLTAASQYSILQNIDLVVNCTSMGMKYSEMEADSPIEIINIAADTLVYDMVYNPNDTPLIRLAQKAGARTLGGLPMLIFQGAAAFEHWTGQEAPVNVMLNAAKKALAKL